jgi:hypothetical protein
MPDDLQEIITNVIVDMKKEWVNNSIFNIGKELLVEQKIDIDRLREDILDYYGTAMFNDFAMAAMNVQFIEMASDQDLIAIAQKEGVDLTKYIR